MTIEPLYRTKLTENHNGIYTNPMPLSTNRTKVVAAFRRLKGVELWHTRFENQRLFSSKRDFIRKQLNSKSTALMNNKYYIRSCVTKAEANIDVQGSRLSLP